MFESRVGASIGVRKINNIEGVLPPVLNPRCKMSFKVPFVAVSRRGRNDAG